MGIEYLGISKNQYPKFRPCSGRLIIAGGGRCVWDDLEKITTTGNGWDVMAVNDIIMHIPFTLKHAYSNDWKMLPKWVEGRRPRYIKDQGVPNSHSCYGNNSWPWPGHGSSGLNACYTALALGYDEIVLAGIPLDNSGHYFDPPWVGTRFLSEVPDKDGELKYWANAAKYIFDGKVKSLSGRTKQLLGD